MAKKSKKKPAAARKPRPAARGMYLTVALSAPGLSTRSVRINSFLDITRLGHQVAGAVREYLRSVPMYPHVRAWSFTVLPRWTQTSLVAKKEKPDKEQSSVFDTEMYDAR